MGLGLPRWVVGMMGKKRMKKFSLAFPDSVDILVRGIKTGLPVHDCFKIIARESPQPLGAEFQLLVEGLGVGMTLAEALDKMFELSLIHIYIFIIYRLRAGGDQERLHFGGRAGASGPGHRQ